MHLFVSLSKVSDTKGRLLSSARRIVKASMNSTGCMRKLGSTLVYVDS